MIPVIESGSEMSWTQQLSEAEHYAAQPLAALPAHIPRTASLKILIMENASDMNHNISMIE
jgi:hypothetical protein